MGNFFGSFGDKLGYKQVPCRMKGCEETWMWSGPDRAAALAAGQSEPPTRMCDRCHGKYEQLADASIPCVNPGCAETFLWNRFAQLESILRGGDTTPPRHMCDSCRDKAKALGDKPQPCRMKACDKTWMWTGRAQLAAGATPDAPAEAPAARMCDACHDRYESLRDQKLPCRIRGCQRGWVYTRWQRLEAELAGKGGERPPERTCDECQVLLGELTDQDIVCRNDGCGGTWSWRRTHQLESMIAAGGAQKRAPVEGEAKTAGESGPPARMCGGCQSRLSKLEDKQVPCKRTGCRGTWLYKRGTQLEKWLKLPPDQREAAPVDHGPARLCDGCRRALDDFGDMEVPCKNDGCKQSWTWTRFAQLQAREAGHGSKPPSHMCEECKTFLTDRKTKVISCATCSAGINWSTELQLKTKLGLMQEPTLCGSCKKIVSTKKVRSPSFPL